MLKNDRNCIKKTREKKGFTSKQLARKLGIEESIMKGIEAGLKHPQLDVLKKMCIILDISSDELLFSETRRPLNLKGLNNEQIETVGYLYKQLKLISEGDPDVHIR